MALISKLTQLVGGIQRQVDLSTNTLVVQALNTGTNTLTDTILGRLISLQNGSDVDATYHTHDTRYYTKTQINKNTASAGSTLVGDDNSYTNFSNAGLTVKSALSAIDTALGASTASSAFDGTFKIKNTTDNTKQIAFDASGISASTVRTITMPDANVNLGQVNTSIQQNGTRPFSAAQSMGGFKLTNLAAAAVAGDAVRYEQAILTSGANAFAADQSFGGFKATNLADPVAGQDAVTLAYFQARLNGLTPKAPARAATTANITLSGTQTIDTVAVIAGDRVLVKNQTLPENNGIYVVAAGAWARSADMDSLTPFDEINGAWVAIREGSQAGQVFVQYGVVTTIGTDPINFSYFNPIAGLIGGDMITFSGSTFSVDLATVSGLESTNPGNVAGQLRIKLEASNPSLQFTGSNELAAKLNAAGGIVSGASGLIVQVDNSTIEINSNTLRVKDLGIGLAKLAANSVDENKIVSTTFSASGAITGGSGTKVAVAVDAVSLEISSNALRVKSTAYDQNTIVGGSGTAASVDHAPLSKRTFVAGEAFAAGTSFAVRFALTGETAGRIYKADKDATTTNKYMAIGIALSAAGVSAGGNIDVVMMGEYSQGGSDSAFSSADVGKELYVGTSGALILGSALAGTTGEAAYCIGVIQTTTKIWVDFKTLRGIA